MVDLDDYNLRLCALSALSPIVDPTTLAPLGYIGTHHLLDDLADHFLDFPFRDFIGPRGVDICPHLR